MTREAPGYGPDAFESDEAMPASAPSISGLALDNLKRKMAASGYGPYAGGNTPVLENPIGETIKPYRDFALDNVTTQGSPLEWLARQAFPDYRSSNTAGVWADNPDYVGMAMGMSSGMKGPGKGPPEMPVQAAFRLPDGRVVHTPGMHDYTKLPTPFNTPEVADPLAGFANHERFWTRAETDSLLRGQNPAGTPINRGGPLSGPPLDEYGMARNRPPTVWEQHPDISGEGFGGPANMPMPENVPGRIAGRVDELGGVMEPQDLSNIGSLPKFFPRPSGIKVPEMPTSGLPDELPDGVIQNLLKNPYPHPANEPMPPKK